jgi:hypothetical protein
MLALTNAEWVGVAFSCVMGAFLLYGVISGVCAYFGWPRDPKEHD